VSDTRSGNDLILNMPGNITFKTASADLNANFYQLLDSVTLVLKEFDKTLIDVEGHTDSDGSDTYNLQLSQQRAGSVGAYLQSHGVNGQRIVTAGAGEARPIASNTSPEGKQQNRRVELKLQPITEGSSLSGDHAPLLRRPFGAAVHFLWGVRICRVSCLKQ
jgi:outer membrane protein OmpA-like peptidoglycan-associated protein